MRFSYREGVCKLVLVDCGEDGLVSMQVWHSVDFKSELSPRVLAALILADKCMRCRKQKYISPHLISPDLKPSR